MEVSPCLVLLVLRLQLHPERDGADDALFDLGVLVSSLLASSAILATFGLALDGLHQVARMLKFELASEHELVHFDLADDRLVLEAEDEGRVDELGQGLRVDAEVEAGG